MDNMLKISKPQDCTTSLLLPKVAGILQPISGILGHHNEISSEKNLNNNPNEIWSSSTAGLREVSLAWLCRPYRPYSSMREGSALG